MESMETVLSQEDHMQALIGACIVGKVRKPNDAAVANEAAVSARVFGFSQWWRIEPEFGEQLKAYGQTVIDDAVYAYWRRERRGRLKRDPLLIQLAPALKRLAARPRRAKY